MGKLHRYRVSRSVDASVETVWGVIRALYLLGPPTREQIAEFEPPHRLRYVLLSGLPFRDYSGEVSVASDGTGTRLSTEVSFRTRIPGSQVFGPIAIRLATEAAAKLAEKRQRSNNP